MSGVLSTLLCVGVQLIFTSGVQGSLSQPHIQFEPGFLIHIGEPVIIQCSDPSPAEYYQISKNEVSEVGEKTQMMMNSTTLTIPKMTTERAGLYTCSYQRGCIWSPPSQPVPLVMTGAYDKPSLFAVPGPMVSPGQSVRLDCVSSVKFEMFSFALESGVYTFQPANLTQGRRRSQASLHVDLATPKGVGSYRCFGYFQNAPYVWSHPSDPLWLQLTDAPSTAPSTQPAWLTESRDPLLHIEHLTHPADSHGYLGTTVSRGTTDPPEHTTITEPGVTEPPNFLEQYWRVMIGVFTAFILLVIFFLLVLRHRRARKHTQRQEKAAHQPPDAQNLGEVTYSQVTCTVTAATKPTLQPEANATSEYATLAFR